MVQIDFSEFDHLAAPTRPMTKKEKARMGREVERHRRETEAYLRNLEEFERKSRETNIEVK